MPLEIFSSLRRSATAMPCLQFQSDAELFSLTAVNCWHKISFNNKSEVRSRKAHGCFPWSYNQIWCLRV